MGFNPIAVTVDPGNIILPSYFKNNVENLSKSLKVPHEYIEVDMSSIVKDAIEGRIHPCGRCSKTIENALIKICKKIRNSLSHLWRFSCYRITINNIYGWILED